MLRLVVSDSSALDTVCALLTVMFAPPPSICLATASRSFMGVCTRKKGHYDNRLVVLWANVFTVVVLVPVQSRASYLSRYFVLFFHASCEGLPGQ